MWKFKVGNIQIGQNHPLVVVSGPCVIEDETHTLRCAQFLKALCERHGIQLIFKASYDKANRSSINSFRGPGLERGLEILQRVKTEFDLPILTDIHHPEEAAPAAEVCAIVQIPAFLCRQTDLILAAGSSGAVVNLKKGQFMAPWDMKHVIEKLASTGNDKIILTERGTSFGYHNLVVDMRSIHILRKFGFPVCFDASHAVQLPGGMGDQSGGQREFILPLAKAALAAGAHLLYLESHPHPEKAKSDKHSVISYDALEMLLRDAVLLHDLIQNSLAIC